MRGCGIVARECFVANNNDNWVDLFDALSREEIPGGDTGFIVTVHFYEETRYAVWEFTPFRTVKNIWRTEDQGVAWSAEGERIYVLYEPATYSNKFEEPSLREGQGRVPLRFSELDIVKLPNNDRILINRDPFFSSGSVSLQKPAAGDFALYIYDRGGLEHNVGEFLMQMLRDDFRVPPGPRDEFLALFDAHVTRIHAMDT